VNSDTADDNPASAPAQHGEIVEQGAASTLQLETFLPYRLSVLANTVSHALANLYRERFELPIPDWRVMAVLARFPGSSARELIQRTRMDKVAISRSVARLSARGLIRRQTSAQDRRRSELRLSEDGRAVYAEIVPLAEAFETRLLESLPPDQRQALPMLLEALQDAAGLLAGSADN
jgi:DNA-binding MarR family transcriptional regulator